MNKTVIKKHTAMSTVLFKKFTAFVVGVISILVLGSGNASAQSTTINPDMSKWSFGFTDNDIVWENVKITDDTQTPGWFWITDGSGHNLEKGRDYTIDFQEADVSSLPYNQYYVGDVKVIIKPAENSGYYVPNQQPGHYQLTATGPGSNGSSNTQSAFKISPRGLDNDILVEGIPGSVTFTGKPLTINDFPDLKLWYKKGQGVQEYQLNRGNGTNADYDVQIVTNTELTQATVTLTAQGTKFTGSLVYTVNIAPVDINSNLVSKTNLASDTYTGCGITPSTASKLKFNNGNYTLVEGVDYTVQRYENNINAGNNTATVVIEGKGHFKGSTTIPFTIKKRSISDGTTFTTVDKPYTGSGVKTSVSGTLVVSGCSTIISENDYDIVYNNYPADYINPGRKSVTIKPKADGNFDPNSSKTVYFYVTQLCLNSANVTLSYNYINPYFDGSPKTLDNLVVKIGNTTLQAGQDYTVAYDQNIEAGNATLIISGAGGYSSDPSCRVIENFTIEPLPITVKPKDKEKEFGANDPSFVNQWEITHGSLVTGYNLFDQGGSISISREAGETARTYDEYLTITNPNKNYDITIENGTFTIKSKCITSFADGGTITLSPGPYVYNHTAITPTVTVNRHDGQLLTLNTDYSLEYVDNINVGTATVYVVGKGNYAGAGNTCKIPKTFQITSTMPHITLTKGSDQCDKTGEVTATFSGSGEYEYWWNVTGATVTYPDHPTTHQTEYSYNAQPKNIKFKDMGVNGADVTIYVKYTDESGTHTDSQTIHVDNYHIDAAGDQTHYVCKDHEYQLNATIPSPSSVYKGEWLPASGPGNYDNPNDPATYIRGLEPGTTTTAQWKITRLDGTNADKCTAVETWTLIDRTITISGSAERLLCDQTTADISTTVTPTSGLKATWTSGGTATITPGTLGASANASVSNLAYGANVFTLKLSDDLSGSTCTDVVSKTFVIYNSHATASVDKTYICSDGEAITLTGNPLTGLPNATGYWTSSDPAHSTIIHPNSYTTQAYFTGTGDVSFTWHVDSYIVDSNGGRQECNLSATTPVISNKKITSLTASDACVSNGATSVSISATSSTLPSGVTGKWTVEGGSTATVSPNDQPTTTVSNLPFGTTTLKWKMSANNTNCPSQEVNVTVVRLNSSFTATPHGVCEKNSQITLQAQDPAPGTGHWDFVVNNGKFVGGDQTNYRAAVYDIGESSTGEATIRWTVSYTTKKGEICTETHDETVYMLAVEPNAGNPQEVCEDHADLSAGPLPTTTPVTTGKWTPANSNVVVTNTADPNSHVTNLQPGQNKFTWTVTRQSADGTATCEKSADVIITYNKVTEAQVADSIYTCKNVATLTAVHAVDGTGYWECVDGYATFENNDRSKTSVKVYDMAEGLNTFRWRVENGKCHSDAFQRVYYIPVYASAGPDQYVCEDHATLQASDNSIDYANVPGISWNKWWTKSANDIIITDESAAMTPVEKLTKGKNTFTWHVVLHLPNGEVCDAQDDVIVRSNAVGEVFAGDDIISCGDIDPTSTSNNRKYLGIEHLNARPLKANETGEWTCITSSSVTISEPNNPKTQVSGLQHYAQQTQPDYWANYNMGNVFVWSVTYEDPNTHEKCVNSDTIQVVWLAPFNANAGEDIVSCADDINLNALDQGAGAQRNWWVQQPVSTTATVFAQPFWGGEEKLVNIPSSYGVTKTIAADGFNAESAETYAYERRR